MRGSRGVVKRRDWKRSWPPWRTRTHIVSQPGESAPIPERHWWGDPSFEGERVFGWCHVSTGSNATFPGGTVRAKIHLDGIISNPTIYLDGEVILKEGKFEGEFSSAR